MTRQQRRAVLNAKQQAEFVTVRRAMLTQVNNSELTEVTAEIVAASGFEELAEALELGVLTVTPTHWAGSDRPGQMPAFLETIADLLLNPGAYPMFDGPISGLVRAMIQEGKVQPHQLAIDHAGRALTGAGMIERLATFPDAPMSSVLQAREELADQLVDYRAATADLSLKLNEKLQSDLFDPAASAAIDDLWREEVQPALQRIRKTLASSRIAAEAGVEALSDAEPHIAAGLSYLAMGVADLSPLLSGALVGSSYLVGFGAELTKQTREARADARGEHLFYLHELDQRFGR